MIRDPEAMPRIPTADADGKFVATPMETGLRFAGTVELAGLEAPPDWRRARILLEQGRRMLPGLRRLTPRGADLGMDGPSPEPTGFVAGARARGGDAGCDLCLRPWPCRDDLGADDRQGRRRPRRRPAPLDRHRPLLCRPVCLDRGRNPAPPGRRAARAEPDLAAAPRHCVEPGNLWPCGAARWLSPFKPGKTRNAQRTSSNPRQQPPRGFLRACESLAQSFRTCRGPSRNDDPSECEFIHGLSG